MSDDLAFTTNRRHRRMSGVCMWAGAVWGLLLLPVVVERHVVGFVQRAQSFPLPKELTV